MFSVARKVSEETGTWLAIMVVILMIDSTEGRPYRGMSLRCSPLIGGSPKRYELP